MRVLGNTGMLVSVVGLGFWASFGTKADLRGEKGINKAKECMRIARDAGINLFDNAETYASSSRLSRSNAASHSCVVDRFRTRTLLSPAVPCLPSKVRRAAWRG